MYQASTPIYCQPENQASHAIFLPGVLDTTQINLLKKLESLAQQNCQFSLINRIQLVMESSK